MVVAAAGAVDPAGLRPFTTLRWAVLGVLAVLAVATARGGGALPRRFAWAWAVLLGGMAVATVTAIDPLMAVVGHPRRHLGLVGWVVGALAFVAGARLTAHERRVHLVRGVVVAAGTTGVAAIADGLGWDPMGVRFGDGRTGGLLGQPVYLGALALLLAPAAFGVAADRATDRRWRWAAVAGGSACSIAIVLSGTRGAWLGVLVAAALASHELARWANAHRRLAAGALVLAAGLAVSASVGARTATLFDPQINGGMGRLDEWRLAAAVIADDPLTGAGPEGYRIAVLAHVDEDYARRHGRHEVIDRAHNAVLDIAATAGAPAAGAYVLLLGLVLWQCGHVIRRRPGPDRFAYGVALGLVAWVVQLQVSFPIAEVDPVAWLLAGSLVSAEAAEAAEATAHAWTGRALRIGATLVAGGLAVSGILAISADRDLHRAEQALPDAPRRAVQAADRATSTRPDDVDAWYVAARVASAGPSLLALDAGLQRVDDGLDHFPLDPALRDLREELLVERALRSGLDDDLQAARRAAAERVTADPANGAHHRRLGLVLAARGDRAAAADALRRAVQLDPDDRTARHALEALDALTSAG
jgi:O-antigen ligase